MAEEDNIAREEIDEGDDLAAVEEPQPEEGTDLGEDGDSILSSAESGPSVALALLARVNKALWVALTLLFVALAWVVAAPPLALPEQPDFGSGKNEAASPTGLLKKDLYVRAFQTRDPFSDKTENVVRGTTTVVGVQFSAAEKYVNKNLRLEAVSIYEDTSRSFAVIRDTSTGKSHYVSLGEVIEAGPTKLTLDELHRKRVVLRHDGSDGSGKIPLGRR